MIKTLKPIPMERWTKFLPDYDEGLGLVYERIVLNNYLERMACQYDVRSVLEAPIFGIAGVSGINSVMLARRGCEVTLVDDDTERLGSIKRIWNELNLPMRSNVLRPFDRLPFDDHSFDLAWNWAALWYLGDPEAFLRELVRVSRRLVFVAMPNRLQVGYLTRKYLLAREFVNYLDESWADMGRIKRVLRQAGARFVDEGVLDVPPWPDTEMPAAQVLKRLGIRSPRLTAQFGRERWNWSTMDYYLGKRPHLRAQIEKYMFLERAPIPWQLKALWAHHRYILAQVG
jgi:SAM-dependent methyltransferase